MNEYAVHILQLILKNKLVRKNSLKLVYSKKNKVNLNAWINFNNLHNNVGDYLSYIVVNEMLLYRNIDLNKTVNQTKHLYAIGSMLLGYQDATIWGTGFLSDITQKNNFKIFALIHKYYHKSDIRAVRGPLSKQIFQKIGINCPSVYGDPALLMPLIYSPNILSNRKKYLIIPHYSELEYYSSYDNVLNTFTDDWQKFIDEICSADLIISSSLHGIILAEAYGIPAILLKSKFNSNIFKYKDYYYSTERYEFPIARNVEEAFKLEPIIPKSNVIKELQVGLINSFPYDLWN